jgi:hypothetical protein
MQVGVTVYLEGQPELLAQRIISQDGAASRPLLAGTAGGPQSLEVATEKIRALLKKRDSCYKNADCIVQLGGQGQLGASAPEVRPAASDSVPFTGGVCILVSKTFVCSSETSLVFVVARLMETVTSCFQAYS